MMLNIGCGFVQGRQVEKRMYNSIESGTILVSRKWNGREVGEGGNK